MNVEIIVVEDGVLNDEQSVFLNSSVGRAKNALSGKGVKFKSVPLADNCRPAKARNAGLIEATRTIVFFIDASMVLAPDFLTEHMWRHHRVRGDFALLGFKQNLTWEDFQQQRVSIVAGSLRPDPRRDWKWSHELKHFEAKNGYIQAQRRRINVGDNLNYMILTKYLQKMKGNKSIGFRTLPSFFQTNIVSVPLEKVVNVGGFESQIQLWGLEDTLLGALLVSTGCRLVPCPSSLAFNIVVPSDEADKVEALAVNRPLYDDLIEKVPISCYNKQRLKTEFHLSNTLTPNEAAKQYGIPESRIREYMKQDKLPIVNARGKPRILAESLEDLQPKISGVTKPGGAVCIRRELSPWEFIKNISFVGSRRLYEWTTQWFERHRKADKAEELFKELLGVSHKVQSLNGSGKPDNDAAVRAIAPLLGVCDEKSILVPQKCDLSVSIEGDVIVLGGANAIPLTKIVWEFDGTDDNSRLDRNPNPILPFRFYGVSNANDARVLPDKVGWYMEGKRAPAAASWYPYQDTKTGRLLRPRLGKRIEVGRLVAYLPEDQYILVTKIPNFVTSERWRPVNSWPQFLFIEGNNGIGTRAAELLTQPVGVEALQHVKKKLRGAPSFQAVFRVFGLELTREGFHRFTKIEAVDWAIEPLEIDRDNYEKANKYARTRLGLVEN